MVEQSTRFDRGVVSCDLGFTQSVKGPRQCVHGDGLGF
jgi:hypothetical protein